MDHNFIIWMGDLNYRIQTSVDFSTEIIKALADLYQFNKLLQHDQLQQQQKRGEAFTHFKEPPIDFKPTYKFDPSTNSWDSSEKNRAPAWCDRILYYCDDMSYIKNLSYLSHPEMIISDHKPVSATFELQVKVVVPDREKQTIDEISFKLDKLYNETLPQVELNSYEFKFEKVKFMVERTQVLKVRNIGHRPVQLGFKPTPDKQDRISKPWLSIRPDKALILTSEEVSINLTVNIDSDHVTSFNKRTDSLDDILVLNLEGGKDIFISVSGDLLSTCFGSSLETLIHVHTYVREVPTGQLLDLSMSSSWEEYDSQALSVRKAPPPLDIPKELYRLVQYLLDHGLNATALFTDGGLSSEREKIRDTLDTGGEELVGSVYSVAAVLLTFLRSLEDPVVPRSVHQRCMDASNNPTLCRQVLLQMAEVHRRCFVFIVTFLKKLLEHSQENKMDAKVLASIFGEVLMNSTREEKLSRNKKTLSQINKKKMTFLYQFLANDLTVNYK
ncbi:PREDICTED: type II inositol 1,4,5-trisphosphate 5-phosphatase-like [Amphimedon queenslandica]|uniref:Rho-GAP domain-containing protein n=1 Tax=Amphimedon queenslandica TaxID=400682 RepID=A0A1X7T340_AMPQE|nr:PREDICTED: type II inositol 1,4,5-trisphosphate 5-phosphatase-like [Amphimedon queenslandica]XP_019861576.1 PREDICTED: type II inositol 1,4,5-trisphosphate 5-phosphatase-like [Amphimedon queenslandica]XP_019861577.1 PREDICTED: type II inositol 1,4,5-trisphosphate 5-phosphatase-like [Amphimedon queenslandica]XP_019861580.1 PREDICTED: type II inositol 1,4,5-trisphosphate 5-phosphatase-like [Amphimedon queenslandica]XP_019861581.1 PREDICTED: type II inositol 1,4,5-trisphosphate 5-phosphatase-li|eukprot:XP_019861575.1 PREDICTED: type II inositol 1,4,5-trisphosphate 5-phosphatase-like [Amphimedon queenslandica]